MKYGFIRDHRAMFSVRSMCRVLMLHVSGFYAWRKEPLSRRAQEDLRQTALIRQAWTDCGKVYGYRKLHDDCVIKARHAQRTAWQGWLDWRALQRRSATNAARDDTAANLQ